MNCTHCGVKISAIQIALSWPTLIKCRSCLAMNGYQKGAFIGLLYMAVLIGAAFAMNIYSGQFSNVSQGIHTSSDVQMMVLLLGPILILLVIGPIYVWTLRRFFRAK